MEEQKEIEKFGHIGQIKHFTVSRRDSLVNDIKNSTIEGIIAFLMSVVSFGSFLLSIYISFKEDGKGGVLLGYLLFGAFSFSIISILLAILGMKKRNKIRHFMEKRAFYINAITLALLIAVYIFGIAG